MTDVMYVITIAWLALGPNPFAEKQSLASWLVTIALCVAWVVV